MSSITTKSVNWPSVADYARAQQAASQVNASSAANLANLANAANVASAADASGVARLGMSTLIHELAAAHTATPTSAQAPAAVARSDAQTITRNPLPAEATE
ncbi:hypothetical protein LFL96_04240 [Paraburkholderia sp. D15]|uniref:hypothetical protein n=1 Tax=Paraburkholderia sp. D15 TaxID=2880218 RepID=UPI00247A4EA4|nr:hypothetical protein [Paraburkholderia sp. D15]WGS50726.1 hypothetical protein LFL96_04240 [Paraburkholderia sp. D15]